MPTVQITGPGVESYTEPGSSDPASTRIGIVLDAIPVQPGGKVRFKFNPQPGQSVYPRVHAFFVPKSSVPANPEDLTPQFLADGGFPTAFADRGGYTRTLYEIIVPGVQPGVEYLVQTVLEYTIPE